MLDGVKTGTRVELSFEAEEGGSRYEFNTTVEDVTGKNQVVLMSPLSGGSVVRLPARKKYQVKFHVGSGMLVFEAELVKNTSKDGEFYTTMNMTGKGKKVQQRAFFRLDIALDITFTMLDDDLKGVEFQGSTRDLSGNGMSFTTDLHIENETEVSISLILDGEYIMLAAKVFGGMKNPAGAHKYLYRASFLSPTDREQDKIVRFINKKQLAFSR